MHASRLRWWMSLVLFAVFAPELRAQVLARIPPPPLARNVAAPAVACGPLWITESATQGIVGGNSFACIDPVSGFTFETHYTRAYSLAAFDIAGAFAVCEVEVAVEVALAVDGSQPLTVALYWVPTGTFPGGALTPIGSATVTIDDVDQAFVTVPVTGTAPPGTDLVVDVAPSNGNATFSAFAIGSNAAGQTAPGYLTAPACNVATPTDLATLGFPDMDIVVNVRGEEIDTAVADAPLRVDEHAASAASNLNGVFEAGETVQVETSWKNPGTTSFSLTGLAQNFTGPAGPVYTIVGPAADYGTLAPSSSSSCHDATGSCFELQISGTRPLQHWDATFDENGTMTPPIAGVPPPFHTWTLHVGESFPDVPVSSQFYRFIETIFHKGVTGGCAAAPNYCPGDPALRKQMAVFVLKAREGDAYTPPPAVGIFNDVPVSDPFAPWIEELFHRGIVAGCSTPGGPNYCPNAPVLRQQMAVFLLRTLVGSAYTPPACTGLFGDVTCPGLFSDWIEDLFIRGIAAGCGGSNFCPTSPITRGQMAPFLSKTFTLSLYGP